MLIIAASKTERWIPLVNFKQLLPLIDGLLSDGLEASRSHPNVLRKISQLTADLKSLGYYTNLKLPHESAPIKSGHSDQAHYLLLLSKTICRDSRDPLKRIVNQFVAMAKRHSSCSYH